MNHGKDPLVSPSAEWLREYKATVDRRPQGPASSSSSSSSASSSHIIRRRHRRRITPQTKYARRRITRMVIVSAVIFVIMAACIYMALSRNESGGVQSRSGAAHAALAA